MRAGIAHFFESVGKRSRLSASAMREALLGGPGLWFAQPARWKKVRQNDGEDAGEKDTVERSRAADRRHRRAKPAHFVEICEIGPDQGAETSGNISQWSGFLAPPLNHNCCVASR